MTGIPHPSLRRDGSGKTEADISSGVRFTRYGDFLMFKKILIDRFRGITRMEIDDPGRANLFVGENNCGKTTVLEAIFLLCAPSNAELPLRINMLRNVTPTHENFWRLIFNNLTIKSDIILTAELQNPNEKRTLRIRPKMRRGNYIRFGKITDTKRTDIKESYAGTPSSVSGLDSEYSRSVASEQTAIVNTEIFADSRGEIKGRWPDSDSETLNGAFINPNNISEGLDKKFNEIQIAKQTDEIVRILRRVEPSVENLALGSYGEIYCDVGLDRLMPINVMGGRDPEALFNHPDHFQHAKRYCAD